MSNEPTPYHTPIKHPPTDGSALVYAVMAADPDVSVEQAGAVLLAMISGVAAAKAVVEQEDALDEQLDAAAHRAAEEARSAAREHQRGQARLLQQRPQLHP